MRPTSSPKASHAVDEHRQYGYYRRAIRPSYPIQKTAKLFEAATKSAQFWAGFPEHEQALKDYGMYVGTAFQIIDDVLDYSGRNRRNRQKRRRRFGRRQTYPAIDLPDAKRLGAGSKRCAPRFGKCRPQLFFEKIHDYVVNSDALPYSISEAKKAVDKAIASLDVLPDSEVKEAMIQLAKESLARVS